MDESGQDARITTVVISLNRRDDLLRSLPKHPEPVILVDNGSTDGTVDAVREQCPQVRVIGLATNRGAGARNLGVEAAGTPYVVFADDDSWWAADARDRIVELFDAHSRLALIAARILVGSGERLDPASAEMAASALPQTPQLPGVPVLGFVACGAAVRRSAFLECGGFDAVVFFPGEEERLALDLAAAGWDLAYVTDIVAHHHPSTTRSTSAAREQLIRRNAILTAVMRRPWRVVIRRCLGSLRSGRTGRAAVGAALLRLPGALRVRRRVPKTLESRLKLLAQP